MTKMLVLYASYSSGTQTAVEKISEYLSEQNVQAVIHRVTEENPNPIILTEHDYDVIVLASPSWLVDEKDGQPHIHMKRFLLDTCKDLDLTGKKFAIFGLGESTYAHFCGAVDVMEGFVKDHGAELAQTSLRVDGFYFNEEENTRILLEWINRLFAL